MAMSETTFDPNTLLGKRLGTYEVASLLGTGGMGHVFRARDVSLDREVALKVLKPDLVRDREFEARFIREARVVAKLEHPAIVQIYSAGRAQGHLFLAMQLCNGETVDQRIRDHGPIPAKEALRVVRRVAEALEYAHQRGLMHRDVKPTNIMIDDAGGVKIMDFGLARSVVTLDGLTKNGVFYGTPEYSSPEQCQTNQIDVRTDIFSLGVVLYEMLTGKVPFVAETPLALFKKISEEQPLPLRHLNPKVPRPVETLVGAMLEKDRERRIPSARAVIEAIDRVLEGSSRPLPSARRATGWMPWAVGLAAGAIAAVAIVLAGGGPAPVEAPPLPPPTIQPVSGEAPVKRPLKVVVADFDMLSADRPDDSYRIAIPDMLISQLAQFRHLSVVTRDQMLWKIRESAPGAAGVSKAHEDLLLRAFSPDLYVTGTYHLRGGMLNFSIHCYKVAAGAPPQSVFTRAFVDTEARFFEMIDEAVRFFDGELRRHASTILAVAVPEAVDPILPARETFQTRFAFAGMRDEAEERALSDRGRRLAAKGFAQEQAGNRPAPLAAADKAEAEAEAEALQRAGDHPAATPGAAFPAREPESFREKKSQAGAAAAAAAVDKVFRDERQRRQWVYSVQAALDRLSDRNQAERYRQSLMGAGADLAALESLNESLRSSREGAGAVQVRVVCGLHGPLEGENACRGCGASIQIVLERVK
jgi:hypothetical protein